MAINKSDEITVLELETEMRAVDIVGTSPLIFNRMAAKGRRELLLPRGRKTAADRAQNLKHSPLEEYRDSVYRDESDEGDTRLLIPSPAFKGAICTAALDLPGTKKTEIGRLTWVQGTHLRVYGTPQIFMSVVRSADMKRTPDIRTRAILPRWACTVQINYVVPKLNSTAIAKLFGAAGILAGVGDFRQEKGKGSFGQFRVTNGAEDDEYIALQSEARIAQDAALSDPQCFDAETEELLSWFGAEVVKLGRQTKKRAA